MNSGIHSPNSLCFKVRSKCAVSDNTKQRIHKALLNWFSEKAPSGGQHRVRESSLEIKKNKSKDVSSKQKIEPEAPRCHTPRSNTKLQCRVFSGRAHPNQGYNWTGLGGYKFCFVKKGCF